MKAAENYSNIFLMHPNFKNDFGQILQLVGGKNLKLATNLTWVICFLTENQKDHKSSEIW